jgi:hypothetical protein
VLISLEQGLQPGQAIRVQISWIIEEGGTES